MIVEFDVQMTKDSVLVIHHDKTIDRCSNGTGTISECYFDQLNQYDYGSWKDLSFSGTKLATLESGPSVSKDFQYPCRDRYVIS